MFLGRARWNYLPVQTEMTQSMNAASGSAPLFMARSASRAVMIARRSSSREKRRARVLCPFTCHACFGRALGFAIFAYSVSADASALGLPRSARTFAHVISRSRVVHIAMSAWGEVDSIFAR